MSKAVARLGKLYTWLATSFFYGLKTIQLSPFIKDIVFTTITSVIITLAAIVVTRLLAEGLGPEKFGAYSLSRRMLGTVIPFSLLGMDLAITRYVATSKDSRTRGSYLLSGLLLAILPSLFISVIGLIFRNSLSFLIYQDEAYVSLFAATLLLIVGYAFYIVLYAFYRGSGRMSRANLWQIGVLGIGPIVIVGSLANSDRVEMIVFLLAILFFGAIIPLGYHIYTIFRSRPAPKLIHPARELLEYGLPRVPAGLALAGILAFGPFLAPHVGTLEDAGYLAAGQSVLLMVEGGVIAFGLVALPKMAQLATAGEREFLRESISNIIAFILHLGLFATLHLLLWADQIVLILLGSQYSAAIPLMRIILLGLIPYLAYVLLRSVVDAVEKKAINTLNLFISFATTLISALLLVGVGLGVRGLALGTTIGFLSLGLLTIYYLWRRYQLQSHSLKLKIALLVNLGFIASAFILKYGLIQTFSGPIFIVGIICIEGGLFALFILILWKTRVQWLVELEKRVIRKSIGG